MSVAAMDQIRKMKGGSQSHLMRASDGYAYVVKFQNNPQHLRVVANEYIVTRLASALGLNVPHCEIVTVSQSLVEQTPELKLEVVHGVEIPCQAGRQFGSRLIGGLMPGLTTDYLPEKHLAAVTNLAEFTGILVLDKWTCNADGRQAVFHKSKSQKRFEAAFIDHGHCFEAGQWTFADAPLRGVYPRNLVYRDVCGWESFEPWMERMRRLEPQVVWEIADTVPPEWRGGPRNDLEALVERLLRRRQYVPEAIKLFRNSSRTPFPKWM